ncbi:MAG: RNA polymerase sigma factor [Verrucomicrobia bacterium]|nr:RNA polymerase sigma factor [Verrucomicrobiota bacterium]
MPVVERTEPAPAELPEGSGWSTSEFAAVYEAHGRQIYYLALRFLGDPALAEDAAHDVFLKAYRKFHEFRGEAAIRTWLYRIAVNHCQNLLQSWHRRHITTVADDFLWDTVPATTDSPLHVLEIKELGQRIQRTLDALPEEYRLLLLLVADEKLSYDEIAELTHQTSDAVRGKLHRARKLFAHIFPKTG